MEEKQQAYNILKQFESNSNNVFSEINRGKINFIGANSIQNLIKYIKILFCKKGEKQK